MNFLGIVLQVPVRTFFLWLSVEGTYTTITSIYAKKN